MGYYLNTLQKGKMYELDGQKLQFIGKFGTRYYFYKCKMDEWSFEYEPTTQKASFTNEEMTYIKRIQENSTVGVLRKIGKDKVFPKN
jgi:hypothetical protein